MTRFRNKILWYWDFIDCNMKVALVFRHYNSPWNITVRIGSPECITLSSLHEVIFDSKFSFDSKECNSQSYHQILSRYFPKNRYNKCGELYMYDTKDNFSLFEKE